MGRGRGGDGVWSRVLLLIVESGGAGDDLEVGVVNDGCRLNVRRGHRESRANALVDEGRFWDRGNLKGVAQEDLVDVVRQVEMLQAAMVMPGTVPGR